MLDRFSVSRLCCLVAHDGIQEVYLAGPMTGREDWNFPAFDKHKAMIEGARSGVRVHSPADPEDLNPDGSLKYPWETYLARDLAKIRGEIDAVFLLPGWNTSRGATLEAFVATVLGIPVFRTGGFEKVQEDHIRDVFKGRWQFEDRAVVMRVVEEAFPDSVSLRLRISLNLPDSLEWRSHVPDSLDPQGAGETNTDTSGGTRFSAGKPNPVWAPWQGIHSLYQFTSPAVFDDSYSTVDLVMGLEWLHSAVTADLETGGKEAGAFLLSALAKNGRFPWDQLGPFCQVAEMGAEKYAPLDWEVGQSFSTLLASGERHYRELVAKGMSAKDAESGLPTWAHALWNIACLLHFVKEGRRWELDDVTPWQGVTTADKRAAEAQAKEEGVSVVELLKRRAADA